MRYLRMNAIQARLKLPFRQTRTNKAALSAGFGCRPSLLPTMTSLICSSLYALSLAATVFASPLSTFSQHPPPSRSPLGLAPLIGDGHVHGTINDSYIVILKDGHPMMLQNHLNYLQMTHQSDALVDPIHRPAACVQYTYEWILRALLSPSTIEEMRKMPEVDSSRRTR